MDAATHPHRLRAALAAAIAAALASCDLGIHDVPDANPSGPEAATACSSTCHGSGGVAAPPRDTIGNSATSARGVGAHRAHLDGSTWHKKLECATCHQVPQEIGDPGHLDTPLPAELIFSGLGLGTTWDGATCTNSYCHGSTPTGILTGGALTQPIWTQVDGTQSACGSCHGLPPPPPHTQDTDCGKCHPTMNPGDNKTIAYPELHIDGKVDVVDTQACDACHGKNGQAAPPKDTTGNTATTARGVGAHAAHLVSNSPWHAPIDCVQCHKVPAGVNDQGHIDTPLPAEVIFGALAGTGTWNGTTCSGTYCHGGGSSPTLTGGAKTSPVWTQVDGTQSQCGSCHGAPPPAPHPSGADCGTCHPTMTPGDNKTITYPALHLDGKVDVTNDQACNACHGSATSNAPPKDTTGGTATDLRSVGAHAQHMTAGATWHKDVACDACHKVPGAVLAVGHLDSPLPAEVIFGALGGATAVWNGSTCANVYCHGAAGTLTGGATTTPIWTKVDGSQSQCGSCHGLPPPPPHPVDADCGACHPTMTKGGGLVITDPSRHIDGNLDVINGQACDSCHGASGNPAPPKDTQGNTATTARGVGAHASHLKTGSFFLPVACGDCHLVPATVSSVGHIDTPLPAELVFSARAGTGTQWNGSRCSNSYCHGGTTAVSGGTTTTPTWNLVDGSQAQCTSCHGAPPPLPHPQNPDCGQCHDTMTAGNPTTITDPSRHIDGKVDVNQNQACNACHGGATNDAPPKDTTGGSATTLRGVGAHQAHLGTGSTWHKDVTCGECHTVPATVNQVGHDDTPLPAELIFTGLAAGSAWNGATCTSYCHGSQAGSTLTGGAATKPIWTKVDGSQSQCGSCHGAPPPAPHPQQTNCEQCHGQVAGPNLTIIAPQLHIDGKVETTQVHPTGYEAATMHGHDFNANGPSTCATAGCHGTALTGGNAGGPSCEGCHAGWQTKCTFCHGGGANQTGAPPAGVDGATAATDAHVGAHTTHVVASTNHAAFACTACHVLPSSALTPGHVDGTGGVVQAEVKFSTMNAAGTFATTTSGCASLYCHGNGRTSAGTATWTSTTAMTCKSCHNDGTTPSQLSGEHSKHISGEGMKCSQCHAAVVDANKNVIGAALHVNGTKDVKFSGTGTYTPANKSCSGLGGGCHGTKTW